MVGISKSHQLFIFSNEIKKENFANTEDTYFQVILSMQAPSRSTSSVDEGPPLLISLCNMQSRHKSESAKPAGSKLSAFSTANGADVK